MIVPKGVGLSDTRGIGVGRVVTVGIGLLPGGLVAAADVRGGTVTPPNGGEEVFSVSAGGAEAPLTPFPRPEAAV